VNIPNPQPKLEEQLRGVMRLKQYSRRTEEGYVQWYKRYVIFQSQVTGRMRHPKEMGAAEVTAFLTNLAVNKNLAASSQNQALNALVFLYREVLKMELEGIDAVRAKRSKHLPVVLTQDEVKTLLAGVKGAAGLAVKLLYGCGLRVAEVLALRVKDVDVAGGKIEVRGGKGDKDCFSRLLRRFSPCGLRCAQSVSRLAAAARLCHPPRCGRTWSGMAARVLANAPTGADGIICMRSRSRGSWSGRRSWRV